MLLSHHSNFGTYYCIIEKWLIEERVLRETGIPRDSADVESQINKIQSF